MTNVYYAVVNSTSCIKKEERRNKLRSILNPYLLIISFLKIKYTYVTFYLFIYLLYFYLSLTNCLKIGEIFFFHYVKTFWIRTPFIFWDKRGLLDTTLCNNVCQWLATGRWFSPGTPVSSILTDVFKMLMTATINSLNHIVERLLHNILLLTALDTIHHTSWYKTSPHQC